MSADVRRQMIAELPRLRAFALSLTRAQADADDLVQATCERALRNLDRWQPGTRLDSWMFRIMRNHWIDEGRRKRPDVSLDAEDAIDPPGEDGRASAENRLALGEAGRAIAALPEEQRSVLVLACVEELSYREIADILGIPIGTVMSRLARARRAVAEALQLADAGAAATGAGGGA